MLTFSLFITGVVLGSIFRPSVTFESGTLYINYRLNKVDVKKKIFSL